MQVEGWRTRGTSGFWGRGQNHPRLSPAPHFWCGKRVGVFNLWEMYGIGIVPFVWASRQEPKRQLVDASPRDARWKDQHRTRPFAGWEPAVWRADGRQRVLEGPGSYLSGDPFRNSNFPSRIFSHHSRRPDPGEVVQVLKYGKTGWVSESGVKTQNVDMISECRRSSPTGASAKLADVRSGIR